MRELYFIFSPFPLFRSYLDTLGTLFDGCERVSVMTRFGYVIPCVVRNDKCS